MTLEAVLRKSGACAALGWRMPAEWEPLDAVWLVRPHNPETWPGCLDAAQREWDAWRSALDRVVTVRTTDELDVPTNDSWIRDFGPIFVVHPEHGLAMHDFRFNGWGGKYEVRSLDDAVPGAISARFGIPAWSHELVLEGGSIEVDGAGTLLTTRQCLENANRNAALGRERVESTLRDALGVSAIIWLPGGITGDDTDGHIDDLARFAAPGVVAAVRAPAGHPDHEVLEANWAALEAGRDARGAALTLVPLPSPEPFFYDFPADRFGPGGRMMLPASHANFLIANGSIFVPVFGGASDDLACRALEQASGLPAFPIMARSLVVGLGSLHCLSCQQPRGVAPTSPR